MVTNCENGLLGKSLYYLEVGVINTVFTASVPGSLKEITCVDFESGWNGLQATRGIYIGAKDVSIKPDTKFGHSADFDGMSSKFWIPRFMNSYR